MTRFPDQEFLSDPDNGTVGDCWRACIAGLLGYRRAEVPHFVAQDETEMDWLEQTQEWLRKRSGFELHYFAPPRYPLTASVMPHVIVLGRSPRGIGHAVLADAATGNLVHDPHPSRDGLIDTTGVFVLSEPWEVTA
jgi:hypothetical protein